MHPVIQHILERKGRSVPVSDGRKIVLILPGGLMSGIRGAGAMIALEQMGLSHAFDAIYSASAGFMNALYLLSDDTRRGTSIYYDDLSGRKFLNFARIWNIANLDYVIRIIRSIKPVDFRKIWDGKTKLFLRLWNARRKRAKYIEIHQYRLEKYFTIAEAAISIPFLHPKTKLKRRYLQDGEQEDSDLVQEINYGLASDATDILIIYNRPEQKLLNLFLQEILNVDHRDRICEICPDELEKLSKFETDRNKLRAAAIQMGQKVMDEFGGGEFRLI
jgi:predicted patatin/cPLA2 family phospholipase